MSKNVKVYSTTTCPWCIRVKQFLIAAGEGSKAALSAFRYLALH